MITNMPAPYRVPSWRIINQRLDLDFNTIFCTKSRIDHTLNSESPSFNQYFLKCNFIKKDVIFIHFDHNIFGSLINNNVRYCYYNWLYVDLFNFICLGQI